MVFKKPIFFLLLSVATLAQNDPKAVAHYNLDNGLAIDGYDPVSYFLNKKPTKGLSKFQGKYNGVLYYFSNQSNKEEFQKSPEKYLPQYGGWCAYAIGSKNEKVSVNPLTYKIVDGKLYLFYNAFFNNTILDWNKDEKNLAIKANKNWANTIK